MTPVCGRAIGCEAEVRSVVVGDGALGEAVGELGVGGVVEAQPQQERLGFLAALEPAAESAGRSI